MRHPRRLPLTKLLEKHRLLAGVEAPSAVVVSGGDPGPGSGEVLTRNDLTYLGTFKPPVIIGHAPLNEITAYPFSYGTNPVIAFRRLSGAAHLFSTTHVFGGGGGLVYEMTVPNSGTWSTSTNPDDWPTANVYRGWGNIYVTYISRNWRVLSGTSTTVHLGESRYLADHYYSGWFFLGLNGGNSGVTRQLISYDSPTRVGGVATNWSMTPVSGESYVLYQDTLKSGGGSAAFLPNSASSASGAYVFDWLYVVTGTGSGFADQIIAYSGINKRAELRYSVFSTLDTTSRYRIARFLRWLTDGAGSWAGGIDPETSDTNGLEGLYYDAVSGVLWWSYGHIFDGDTFYPSMGYSVLDDETTTAVPYGPWRLSTNSAKWSRGGITAVPSGFTSQHLPANMRLAAGFGGNYAVQADASYGPCLTAFVPPTAAQNKPAGGDFTTGDDDFPKVTAATLFGYPAPPAQPNTPTPGRRNSGYVNRDPAPPFLGRQSDDYPAYNFYTSGLSHGGVSGPLESTGTYVILNPSDPGGLYYYNGGTLTIGGNSYIITEHNDDVGGQKRAYLYNLFAGSIPASGAAYHVRGGRVFIGPYASGGSAGYKTGPYFKENRAAVGFGLVDHRMDIVTGYGSGQTRYVTENFRDSLSTLSGEFSITVSEPWTTVPVGYSGGLNSGGDSSWRITGGTARSGTTTRITTASGALYGNFAAGRTYFVNIIAGAASGSESKITSVDVVPNGIALNVSPAFSAAIDNTSEYGIYAIGFGDDVWDYQSGTGYWTWEDTNGGGAWFQGTNKRGVIVPSQQGVGHVFYEASDRTSTSGHEAWFYIYDPEDFLPVLSGTIASWQVEHHDYFQLPQMSGMENERFGTAVAIDPQDKVLYVFRPQAIDPPDSVDYYAAVHVYQISD